MPKWVVSLYYIRGAHLEIYLRAVFLPWAPLFSPILTSFFLAGVTGNIIPKKQPPLAAALKKFCMLNCLLAARFKEYQKFRSYCCFKQIILAFMFENLIKNQLLSGLRESVILCLQQWEGIIRGQKLEFSNRSLLVVWQELLWTTPFSAPCSQLNSWDAPHIEASVLVGNRI